MEPSNIFTTMVIKEGDDNVKTGKIKLEWFDEVTKKEITNLLCPICSELYINPILLSCGDILCKKCFENNNNKCPNLNNNDKCKKATIVLSQVPFILTIIDNKCIKCKNTNCTEKCHLRDLVSHLEQCPKELIPCKFQCGREIPRESLHEHEQKCDYRIVVCTHCNQNLIFKDLSMHNSICSMKLIICALCKVKILRKNLTTHLDRQCPQAIRNCFYGTLGCEMKMKLEDSKEHYIDKREYHITQYSDFLLESKKKLEQNIFDYESKSNALGLKFDGYITSLESQTKIIENYLNKKEKEKENNIILETYVGGEENSVHVPKKRGRKKKIKKY